MTIVLLNLAAVHRVLCAKPRIDTSNVVASGYPLLDLLAVYLLDMVCCILPVLIMQSYFPISFINRLN